jgi:excinuclease UvrABC nuclease subunit
MKKLELDWQGYYKYTSGNVQKYAPTKGGVYKISFRQKNGNLKVRYVGQANDLDRRLKEHLDLDNEQNECLVERLKKYNAEFSFAEISTQNDRNGAEKALYDYYKPVCNDPDKIPNGPDIEINPR